jgi:hypothetical protein
LRSPNIAEVIFIGAGAAAVCAWADVLPKSMVLHTA